MASIVQAGIPVGQNPGLEVAKLASTFGNLKAQQAQAKQAQENNLYLNSLRKAQAQLALQKAQESAQWAPILQSVFPHQQAPSSEALPLGSAPVAPTPGALGVPHPTLQQGGVPAHAALSPSGLASPSGALPLSHPRISSQLSRNASPSGHLPPEDGASLVPGGAASPHPMQAQQAQQDQQAGKDSDNIYGIPLNPLQLAMLNHHLGFPVQSPATKDKMKAQAQYYKLRALGPIAAAVKIANSSDQQLSDLGYTPAQYAGARHAQIQTIIKGLPANYAIQYTSGIDFLNQFNGHLRGATLHFMNSLKHSGIKGLGAITLSGIHTFFGGKNTLYDEYRNLLQQWSTSVSDYRNALGDHSTDQQLKYVKAILRGHYFTQSFSGILKMYNNLLSHTSIQLHGIEQNSALKDVKSIRTRHHPELFDTGADPTKSYLTMRGQGGGIFHVPREQLIAAQKVGLKLMGGTT